MVAMADVAEVPELVEMEVPCWFSFTKMLPTQLKFKYGTPEEMLELQDKVVSQVEAVLQIVGRQLVQME